MKEEEKIKELVERIEEAIPEKATCGEVADAAMNLLVKALLGMPTSTIEKLIGLRTATIEAMDAIRAHKLLKP